MISTCKCMYMYQLWICDSVFTYWVIQSRGCNTYCRGHNLTDLSSCDLRITSCTVIWICKIREKFWANTTVWQYQSLIQELILCKTCILRISQSDSITMCCKTTFICDNLFRNSTEINWFAAIYNCDQALSTSVLL